MLFFFKQKTAYEMRISDWSSDVCSSDLVEFVRGNFRARGEIIDVFPAEHAELALRITLFDDEIESLEMFDPLTGKIKQKIPRFTVFPSSHYVTPREAVLRAIETIKIELRERLAALVADGKLVEADRKIGRAHV